MYVRAWAPTWMAAICGVTMGAGVPHWADRAPLAGWRPTAVASIADTTINSPVRYELGARGRDREQSLKQPEKFSTVGG